MQDPDDRKTQTQGLLRNHVLRSVRAGLLGLAETRHPLFGTLPKSVFAVESQKQSTESEKRKMALLYDPSTEDIVSGETHRAALAELRKREKAAAILESAVLAVIDCKDTVLKEGTQRTFLRVCELCAMAWAQAETAMMETPDEAAKADEPFCTNCQTHLSESSLQAGYCLKCTYASTQQ